MSAKIAIIDYEMGNLRSVAKAFEYVGADVVVTRDRKRIQSAAKLVLPGVGAYGRCMDNLEKFDLVAVIKSEIKKGKPFLGVCLGLQLLFEESEESDGTKGLGVIPGIVKKFDFRQKTKVQRPKTELKVPHMGWNRVCFSPKACGLFEGFEDEAEFYFAHSYYVCPEDQAVVAGTTEYGVRFCAAICKDNIFACQFHPEKSQRNGLKLVENFYKLRATLSPDPSPS